MADNQNYWYVVYSKPHKEEQAQCHLRAKGIDVFFPRLNVTRVRADRRRVIPLFPNYLFVRIRLETEAHRVMWSPGVKRIITFGERPVPLDDEIVDFLQRQTGADGTIKARSRLQTGQEVEIRGGPFDGLIGIIQDPPDAKGRVRVLLRLLSRRISVKMGVEFIQGDWSGLLPEMNFQAQSQIGHRLISAAS